MTCTNKQTKKPAEADQAKMPLFRVGKHGVSVRQTFVGGSLGVSQHLVLKDCSPSTVASIRQERFIGCLLGVNLFARVKRG